MTLSFFDVKILGLASSAIGKMPSKNNTILIGIVLKMCFVCLPVQWRPAQNRIARNAAISAMVYFSQSWLAAKASFHEEMFGA
jgi:hypothetical protein